MSLLDFDEDGIAFESAGIDDIDDDELFDDDPDDDPNDQGYAEGVDDDDDPEESEDEALGDTNEIFTRGVDDDPDPEESEDDFYDDIETGKPGDGAPVNEALATKACEALDVIEPVNYVDNEFSFLENESPDSLMENPLTLDDVLADIMA